MGKRTIALPTLFIGLVLSLAIVALAEPSRAAEVRVIANENAPVKTMDAKMVRDVFLGKIILWNDGSSIEFVTLKPGDTHEAFLKAFVKKTPSQFNSYWARQVFTGKGAMPKTFATESELVAYVRENKGAVGYVSSSADVASVKVVNEK